MNQSSFDCIFTRLLATPNNRRGTNKGRLHGRDASCAIDEHRKSVSVAGPGYIPARRHRPGGPRRREPGLVLEMTATEQTSSARSGNWLANQPYLLLCITALCWAGNAIVGRLAAGHIAPVTLSFLRWSFAFLIILPFAWQHLAQDWAAIRGRLGIMIVLSITGIGAFNTLQYWALEHTQAMNTLLLQSAAPLVVAVWSLVLLGVRLTLAQAAGVLLSMAGVLVILLHGDLTKLSNIEFNRGDLIFILALVIFGLYSVLSLKRPTSTAVLRRLHLRRRRGLPDPAVHLGTVHAAADADRYERTC